MLSKALKLIRVFHNLNQQELASLLDISRSHVSEIENGKNKPSYDLLEKYAEVFEVPVSNLIFFAEHLENNEDIEVSKFKNFIASKILNIIEFLSEKATTNT